MGITNNRDTTRTQNFTYDTLNRIATANTQATTGTNAWGLQFGYDIWANLLSATVTQGSAPMLSQTADGNNRIVGFCYDAVGNLLAQSAPPCPSPTYAYNAESQMTSTAGVTYSYDGDGKRVKKSSGKLYWYGMGSDPLDETDASGNITNEYIFFGGKRIAKRDASGNVDYYFADHLGTSRVVTNSSGTILDDSDFYPFGGERPVIGPTSGNNYKFTGKEHDSESGLDDFDARYYSSSMGRFMTPDWAARPTTVPYAVFGDPQSLNLYGYVRNDPVSRADADGHDAARLCSWDASDAVKMAQGNGEREEYEGPTYDPGPQEPKEQQPQEQQERQGGVTIIQKRGHGRHKGERRRTVKPDKPPKGIRTSRKHPDQWEVQNPQTGKWVEKPKGWSPYPITNFEIQRQQEAAQSKEQFWKVILVCDLILGVVATGGATGGGAGAVVLAPAVP